jgi:hypothetical protein
MIVGYRINQAEELPVQAASVDVLACAQATCLCSRPVIKPTVCSVLSDKARVKEKT